MRELLQIIFYQPILNIFVGLYNLIPDVGIVILFLTILIKLILYPLTNSSIKAQKSLSDLQPKINEIKEKYKDDQQKIAQETMRLYRENKVNPFGSCLPLLIQLPILIALFYVLRSAFSGLNYDLLYSFIKQPESIKTISLGFLDLAKPNIILALLSALAQFWQTKMLNINKPPKKAGTGAKDEELATVMNKQMMYFMPFMTFLIGVSLPGGLTLYWLLSTLFMVGQQLLIFKNKKQETAQAKLK